MNWSKVKLIIWDFDGVFTDNKVYTDQNGIESVMCDRGDGMGLELLRKDKPFIKNFVLSKERNPVVSARCKKVKVDYLQSQDDKPTVIKSLMEQHNLSKDEVMYVGNDVNDVPCFEVVGIAVAVANAVDEAKEKAHATTKASGGNGAIREICDKLRKL